MEELDDANIKLQWPFGILLDFVVFVTTLFGFQRRINWKFILRQPFILNLQTNLFQLSCRRSPN
jgi:hypothetical protein